MQILYENKKTTSDIIKLAKNIRKIDLSIFEKDNFFIEGDNFDVMANLLDIYSSKIDLIYIDPPYNTMSDFMYSENKTSTISYSQEESILAYKDKMSLDDYLEFIRERLILINLLLSDRGTLYFHIDVKNGHYIKILLDEIFGKDNFVNDITRIKSNPKNFSRKAYGNQKDVIYIYSKKVRNNIFNDIKIQLDDQQKI
ncbi:site-specific DNA-methyltransferase, partial [bacterium]|nr:site-specific DNA-methyltransferase [bacterium]